MMGMINKELTPDTINTMGNWCWVMCKLLIEKALLQGIIIKPPMDNMAVDKKPIL
jgi:hypothetical protein